MTLPKAFQNRMEQLLNADEYAAFIKSYDEEYRSGLRINTLKTTKEEWLEHTPFSVKEIPWVHNGFYYENDKEQVSKHPYYYAGLYYMQEPSAMTPAELLSVEPGERVLDLCAAPGGKSTELAAKLQGEGILVSNDISNSRAKALLKNLELFGVKNALILSETPAKLSSVFTGFFDKILVDAPCSGEGMFRKTPAIMKNWEQYGVAYYQKLQKEILPFAVEMLKPGGMLLYSTCTFSPEEDEGTVSWLLTQYKELSLVLPALSYEGFDCGKPEWIPDGPLELRRTIRLWPHKLGGEGHFAALFQKSEAVSKTVSEPTSKNIGIKPRQPLKKTELSEEAKAFLKKIPLISETDEIDIREDRIYLLPKTNIDIRGLRVLRFGLLLGEMKKNRFEPSQALANALSAGAYENQLFLDPEGQDILRFLKGETLCGDYTVDEGTVLVFAGRYPVGWGKASKDTSGNVTVKNRYLPGWRMM